MRTIGYNILTGAFTFGFLATVAVTPAHADPVAYETDPSHTDILFLVSHFGYSNSFGSFGDFDIDLAFDQETPENSTLSVVVRPVSVDTTVPKLDEHLRSPDFFGVEAHPEATFVSTGIEITGEKTGIVTGDLTLLGVTKPVTLDVTFNKAAPHPINKRPAVGFSATGTITRTDFGMDTYAPAVGDEVKLIIEYEGFEAGT
ncbi:MAG: YceI family protein [Alphaproteobacteria bacterium]|nr:YceI family protein [Alphaproteobacteria bacterium]